MIQEQINRLLEVVGLDSCNLKILICALLLFPFLFIFKRLPDKNYTLKNVYNIAVSVFYLFGICDLGLGIYTLLFSSVGCYFITRYVRSPAMPWINFLFLMGHLAVHHFHNQFFNVYDPTVIDITGAQMVLVMKLSAFGWNIYDGRVKNADLWPYAKERVVADHPNLLSYFGYVFYYASLLTGPAFDFADYDKYIKGTLFSDVPPEKRPRGKRVIPRSGKQAFAKTMRGFFWAFLFVNVDKWVLIPYMESKAFLNDHYLIYRMFYMWILGFLYRLKYYAIWLIAEGACILGGIGYNGYDEATGKFKWDRVQNIDEVAFETGQNVHVCLEAWNMNTNKWLKNYVYLRVPKRGQRPGFKLTLLTFATLAFWHGTRPGYYLTFITGALMQSVGKIFRRQLRPIFLTADGAALPSKRFYDIVCWFVTQLSFGYAVQPFMLLEFGLSLKVWAVCYFWLHMGMFATFFVFRGPFTKSVTRWLSKYRADGGQPKKKTPTSSKGELLKLTDGEVGQVTSALKSKQDVAKEGAFDYHTLGLPSFELLEDSEQQQLQQEVAEIKDAWTSFKNRNGIHQEDFDGLKNAFNNFVTEVNEIIATYSQENGAASAKKNN